MPLYLIRHPKPVIEPGVCYGQSDIAIADYDDDVQRIKHLLADVRIDQVVSSPLQRCWQFAQALAWPNLTADERLMELHFGDWELQPWDAIDRQQLDVWSADFCRNAPPNGESYNALAKRVHACLIALEPLKNTVFISHAGPIRAALAQTLGLPLGNSFRLRIDYASVSAMDFSTSPPCVLALNCCNFI